MLNLSHLKPQHAWPHCDNCLGNSAHASTNLSIAVYSEYIPTPPSLCCIE